MVFVCFCGLSLVRVCSVGAENFSQMELAWCLFVRSIVEVMIIVSLKFFERLKMLVFFIWFSYFGFESKELNILEVVGYIQWVFKCSSLASFMVMCGVNVVALRVSLEARPWGIVNFICL